MHIHPNHCCLPSARRVLRSLAGVSLAIFVTAAALAAEPLPALRPVDCFPDAAAELKIEWKATWDETLAANKEDAWNQALGQKEAYRQAADRIVRLWRIELLQQMIAHFPADRARHLEACRTISETYRSLDDRTRSALWLKKLADGWSADTNVAVEAYAGILRYADPPEAMPGARSWVEYAVRGIEAMEKAGTVQRGQSAAVLARQRAYGLPLRERRYEDARRVLERYEETDGVEPWRAERVALLTTAGHFLPAAQILEATGTNAVQSKELRGRLRPVSLEDVGSRAQRDLEMRLAALDRKEAGVELVLGKPDVVEETLRMSAETGSMWSPDPSRRVLCWLAVDQLLRDLKPEELRPLRQLQEQNGGPLAEQLGPAPEGGEVLRLFHRYPWAASTHERLIAFGESALREGDWNPAQRAFQNVLTHSADPVLTAQARVGLWLAMASAAVSGESLAASMAAVADDAKLPWRGESVPAADVKRAIRALVPPGAATASGLADLRRMKLRLPAELASDEPVPQGPYPAPRGLGPWGIRRIEIDGDLLFVMGSAHVACYSADNLSLRWVQTGNPSLDMRVRRPAAGEDGSAWPEPAWRPVSMGTAWSRAVMDRPGAAKEGKAPSRTLFSLLCYNLGQGLSCDVAAFDVQSGRVLWHTRGQPEWIDLDPLSEPSAADGFVYVVACNAAGGPACPLYLVCLDGETGKMAWKRLLGAAAAEGELRELARLGSAVTVFQEAVYVSTGLGLLARCNAADGVVEWVRSYASAVQGERLQSQFRREGCPPLVIGNRVVVAPRDHSGVLAVNRTTGELLWETLLVPSEQLLGAAGATLVFRGHDTLAGLDLVSGKERWTRPLGEEPNGARALVAGTNVFVVAREKLVRVSAVNGGVVEELRCARGAGTDQFLLPSGALVEVGQDFEPIAAAATGGAAGAPQVPLTNEWAFACANALLVTPPAGRGPENLFGVLSGRTFLCVNTKPRCAVAWRTLLRDGADSAGFHGKLVITAHGRVLTALDAATGALCWTYRLPFDPQVVAGDVRVIVAGDLTPDGKVAALDAATGALLWLRWFGKETRFAGNPLAWISMRSTPADPSALLLHCRGALFGKEGWRPAEVEVDALSGTLREPRLFLADEPGWPARIVFGDNARTYARKQPFFFPSNRLGFRRDAVAFLGKESRIRFFPYGQGPELAPGWKRTLTLQEEGKYAGALGLGATPVASYLKQLQQLFGFDAAAGKEIVYASPADAERTIWSIFDWREFGDKLLVVSAGQPPPQARGCAQAFTHTGLKDDTGRGDVTLKWFTAVDQGSGGAQVHSGTFGYPEAGVNPVTTLLDGNTKEHYRPQYISMSGLSSLGWDTYDVYFYSTANAQINGGEEQKVSGFDPRNPVHRTTFIRGVNYIKFAGVKGDAFKIQAAQCNFSAIQIVDASTNAAAGRKAACLGVNWDGGGVGLGPDDMVGAEVKGRFWYNIAVGYQLQGGYQSPVIYADVFDRNTGALLKSQKLSVAPRDHRIVSYDTQAVILDDALVVADQRGVQVLRAGPPEAAAPAPPAAAP